MTSLTDAPLDYDRLATAYARHRQVHPGVVAELVATGLLGPQSRVLDVGCGTGNYAAVLGAATGCCMSGVEPSARMLERAREAVAWEALAQGSAEALPFADAEFDVVMSSDVIHHVRDRGAYFAEALRVLRPDGWLITITDSRDDILRRRPLSSHFPETVEVELRRYPSETLLIEEMTRAGFVDTRTSAVRYAYDLAEIQAYRDRAFSSLQLIDDAEFARGIARLEADLARGPIPCLSLYTLLWARAPRAPSGRV
jgi:ubiquinone/menaquinone biosynthesis C-methylase UbiE